MEPLGDVFSFLVVRKHIVCFTFAMQLFVTGPGSKDRLRITGWEIYEM